MIEFLCPNGHRIRCPDNQAGRAAKCPKCQVRFRVPDPADDNPPSEAVPNGEAPAESDRLSVGKRPSGKTDEGDSFDFLCPNGHRLHGPTRLQGQPGECPTCGAKFRVPSYEDLSGQEVPDQPIAPGGADAEEEFDMVLPDIHEDEPSDQPRAVSLDSARHPTAELLLRMWEHKRRGATLEIRLVSGETMIPDHFASKSAASSHALLAAVERDATYTVYLVSWDAIQRVLLRGVKSLPEEFEKTD